MAAFPLPVFVCLESRFSGTSSAPSVSLVYDCLETGDRDIHSTYYIWRPFLFFFGGWGKRGWLYIETYF